MRAVARILLLQHSVQHLSIDPSWTDYRVTNLDSLVDADIPHCAANIMNKRLEPTQVKYRSRELIEDVNV